MATRLDSIDWDTLAVQCGGNVHRMTEVVLTSRRTLERYFRIRWGLSPRRWAKRKVLEKALALLRQGYANKAVVLELRLSSESWFCREIKAHYGASPQFFRTPGARVSQIEQFDASRTHF